MLRPYTIARLASAAGVHIETIRYYQRRRLLSEPAKPTGGIRRYTDADVERVRFIKRAQAMGFALAEITSLLSLKTQGSCGATRELAAAKLRLVDTRIRELRDLRRELASLIADCDVNPQDRECPILRRLTTQPSRAL
jgi:MerR family mercuric resistance operon transcriptional regulator